MTCFLSSRKDSQVVLLMAALVWLLSVPAVGEGYYYFRVTGPAAPTNKCTSKYPSPKVAIEHCRNKEDPYNNGMPCSTAYTGYRWMDEAHDKENGLMRGWALWESTCPDTGQVNKLSTWMPRQGIVCSYPYTYKAPRQCVTYCPPHKPELDRETGLCYAEGGEPMCTVGNPIKLIDGQKVLTGPVEYAIDSARGIAFRHFYRSGSVPEADVNYGVQQRLSAGPPSYDNWVRYTQPSDYQGIKVPFLNRMEMAFDDEFNVIMPPAGHKQWRHSFYSFLYVHADEAVATLFMADGDVRRMEREEGLLGLESPIGLMKLSSNEWQVQINQHHKAVYSTEGYPQRVSFGGENWIEYIYDDEERIIELRMTDGSEIQLFYTDSGDQLVKVNFPDGSQSRYEYDVYGNMTSIKTAYSGEDSIEERYRYDDSRNPYALTARLNENGVALSEWEYDQYGRAHKSTRSGSNEVTRIDYSNVWEAQPEIAVTNELGKKTSYYLNSGSTHKKVVAVEGHASANCAAANKDYEYYANGTLKAREDWSGNITTYQRDNHGREIVRTEAAGTPEARTIETEWHPTLNLKTKIVTDEQTTVMTYHDAGWLISKTVQANSSQ